jgi:hypothetical protein
LRPAKIKILGKPFAVSFVPADHIGLKDGPDDGEPGDGRQDTSKQEIYVRDGQPLETEQDTVLHEVIHSVEETLDMGLTEDQVTKLATVLLAVVKDNPSFVRYLASKKKNA